MRSDIAAIASGCSPQLLVAWRARNANLAVLPAAAGALTRASADPGSAPVGLAAFPPELTTAARPPPAQPTTTSIAIQNRIRFGLAPTASGYYTQSYGHDRRSCCGDRSITSSLGPLAVLACPVGM